MADTGSPSISAAPLPISRCSTDAGLIHQSKISSTPDDPSIAVIEGVGAAAGRAVDRAFRHRRGAARHHRRLQHHSAAQGRANRTDHHARLSRRAGNRPHPHARHVRPDLGQAEAAGAAAPSARSHRAHGGRRFGGRAVVGSERDQPPREALVAEDIEAVAIAFINSYRNPAHELQAEAILRASFPQLLVTTSCAVLPEMKEYERTSTTVVNAYLLAAMRSYLERLESGLRAIGIAAPILVMTSNGGMLAADGDLREAGAGGGLRPGRRRDRRARGSASHATIAMSSCSTWAAPRPRP